MAILIIGLLIFFSIHLIPSFVNLRRALVDKLGEGPYKGLYSLGSLMGVVVIVYGMSQAPFVAVWDPLPWGRSVVFPTMLLVFYLFVAADRKTNIKRLTRHPMLLGILLWSSVHLLVNGDKASIILFSSFAAYSLIAMWSANRRGATLQQQRQPLKNDVISAVAGIAAYILFVFVIHPYLIRVPLIY